jgi:O-antigen/teichoic acid export membrane protein
MSVLKKLAGETALYGVSSILGRLLNYLLVPLHTAVFGDPSELAITVKLFAYVAFLNVLYTYGMETAFFRFASKSNDPEKYYNVALTAIILSSTAFSLLIIGFATPIANYLGYPGTENLITWLAIILAIDAVVAIPFAKLRLDKKPKQFVFARMANIFLNVGLNFFFLWFCRGVYRGEFLTGLQPVVRTIYNPALGVGYIFLANLIANLALFPLLGRLFTRFRFVMDRQTLAAMWQYGYPILIVGLAGTVNLMFDRIFLSRLLPEGFYPGRTSEDALGIYGQCYKLSIFMSLATQAFRYAAEPFFFSQSENKNAPGVFADVTKWFIIVCAVIWLGVSVNLGWIGPLFLRKQIYWEGLSIVPVLLLANLFLGVYYNISAWFKLTDRTQYGTYLTFVGAVITVAGNVALIPVLGYMGCAVAFLASCVVMTVLCYVLGQKYYPVPYRIGSAAGYLAGAGGLIVLASLVAFDQPMLRFAFGMALCGVFVAAILLIEKPALRPRRAVK